MHEDPVMKISPKPIGELQGQVKAPTEASDMLDAVKILMRMLKDAGIILGSFDANELFDMEQSAIRETTLNLFTRLTPIAHRGEQPNPWNLLLDQNMLNYFSFTKKEAPETNATPSPALVHTAPSRMQSFFDAAKERFLKEQQQASSNPPAAGREPADPKL
ncbi:unnamed protein product [Phytophthora fragariaefolia]|uniref:Unnamed protein product n=1 Tax=Phytophthora fragariaefolia TaxID=1490495 RepID=A0A9W6Y3M6_9STRA|nr:unnamed protein product [Phytophthora fragariaefolia]